MTKQEILNSLKHHNLELNEKFGIEQLALFGSYAKDEQNNSSDVDLLIIKMKKKNAFTLIKARIFLSNLLGVKVDLGLFDSLRPFIKQRVEKDMIYV